MSEKQHRTVTLEVDMNEPALVPAAFDLLRLNARACGLRDVGQIYIHLKIEVEGSCYEGHVKELRERLGVFWFGDVTGVKVKEPRQPEESSEPTQ
jgi:hypothetical protein